MDRTLHATPMHRKNKPGRTAKACTNCRQQKKAELQQEVQLLRQQMAMGSRMEQTYVEERARSSVSLLSGSLPSATEFFEGSPGQNALGQSNDYIGSTLEISTDLDNISHAGSTTTPQALNTYEVDAQKIDDCFALYFSNYSRILPILNPRLSPNTYFSRSPLLFWTIVAVGSRRYDKDPTLLTRIAPSIQNMALLSLSMREAVIEVIQSLLLLSMWPFPFNSVNKAMTHIFCGAAVNLAQQIGMHVAGVGQDFARVKLIPNESEKAYRAQLWQYCIIINQSSSYAEGYIPSVLPLQESNSHFCHNDLLLSPELKYYKQIHQVTMKATQLMQTVDVSTLTNWSSGHLHSLIELSDRELFHIPPPPTNYSDIGNIYLCSARLHIRSYCFFCEHGPENFAPILRLYAAALETINAVIDVDGLAIICTFYIHRMLMLAAISILRILRSDLHRPAVDGKAGENAYFSVIRLLKQMSIAHDDLSARGADILAQLWASDALFRRRDGTRDSLSLRIRSRLPMSAVYDCYWWWREEYAGIPSPFNEDHDKDSNNAVQNFSFFGTTFDDLAEFGFSPAFDGKVLDTSVQGDSILPSPVS